MSTPLTPLQALKEIHKAIQQHPLDVPLEDIKFWCEAAIKGLNASPPHEPVNTRLLNALKEIHPHATYGYEVNEDTKYYFAQIVEIVQQAVTSAEQPDEPISEGALRDKYGWEDGGIKGWYRPRFKWIAPNFGIRVYLSEDGNCWKVKVFTDYWTIALPGKFYFISELESVIAALTIGVQKGAGDE